MATERSAPSHDHETATPEEQASIQRALAASVAGGSVEHPTLGALEQFVTLDDADARRLLDNPDELRRWFAAHA
jgi:hypothetical protein